MYFMFFWGLFLEKLNMEIIGNIDIVLKEKK